MTRRPLPLFLCLCLSLLLGLAGMRPVFCPGAPVSAVAACGHDGVIWLDAQGAPVKPCAHCDQALGPQVALLTPPPAPALPAGPGVRLRSAPATLALSAPQPQRRARAPPFGT